MRQNNALLELIFPLAVGIGCFADLIRLEKEYLGYPLVGVNARRQWRCVRNLQRDVSFPLRLERRDVDDKPAPRIGALAAA